MEVAAARFQRFAESRRGRAIVYCLSMVFLGCSVLLLGPSILEFSVQTHATVTATSYIQGLRGFAYMAGGLLCGIMFDKLPGHPLLAAGLGVGGLATLLQPLARSWWALAILCIIQGFALCFVDTGGNVMLLFSFDGAPELSPWMQALHASFAIGAFIAPLLLRVVASAELARMGVDETTAVPGHGAYKPAYYFIGAGCIALGALISFMPSPAARKSGGHQHHHDAAAAEAAAAAAAVPGGDDTSGLADAAAGAVVDASPLSDDAPTANPVASPAASVTVFSSSSTSPQQPAALASSPPPAAVAGGGPSPAFVQAAKRARRHAWLTVTGVALLMFAYVGAETGWGFYATAFTVFEFRPDKTEADGQYLTSAFWGAITVGRVLAVPLSTRFKPDTLLKGTLTGCLISVVALAVVRTSFTGVWLATLAYGLFMACVYPTAVALCEGFIPVEGRMATLFVLGGSGGEWLFPFLIGTLLGGEVDPEGNIVLTGEGPGPQIAVWVVLAATFLTAAAFVAVRIWGANAKQLHDEVKAMAAAATAPPPPKALAHGDATGIAVGADALAITPASSTTGGDEW